MQCLSQITQKISLIKLSDIHKVFGPLQRIAKGGKLVPISYEEMKKFDLDLKFGHFGEGGFIFDVTDLKGKIRALLKEKKAKIVMGGDFDASQMVLLPIKELFS